VTRNQLERMLKAASEESGTEISDEFLEAFVDLFDGDVGFSYEEDEEEEEEE